MVAPETGFCQTISGWPSLLKSDRISATPITRVNEKFSVVLASVALICAGVLVVTDIVLTVKVVLVKPVMIVTDAGTVASGKALDKLIVVVLWAAELKPTVQVDVAGGVTAPGLQFNVESTGAG